MIKLLLIFNLLINDTSKVELIYADTVIVKHNVTFMYYRGVYLVDNLVFRVDQIMDETYTGARLTAKCTSIDFNSKHILNIYKNGLVIITTVKGNTPNIVYKSNKLWQSKKKR